MCRRSNVFIIGLLMVGTLALASIGIGIILVQHASIPGSSGLQATPAFGVTHVLIRNNTYQPDSIEVGPRKMSFGRAVHSAGANRSLTNSRRAAPSNTTVRSILPCSVS